jgi:hypothetical protein
MLSSVRTWSDLEAPPFRGRFMAQKLLRDHAMGGWRSGRFDLVSAEGWAMHPRLIDS